MSDRLTQLVRLAAGAEPPALDEAAARRMIDRAIASPGLAGARSTAERCGASSDLGGAAANDLRAAPTANAGSAAVFAPRSLAWPIAAVALAVIAAIAWLVPRGPRGGGELVRVALPTGDHLVGTAGARFELERVAPADRRVRLREGAMVFDVAHAVPGQRFEVAAGDVVVVAKGTVFSVAVADGIHVSVYEGAVEVVEHGRVHAIVAGQAWPEGTLTGDPRELAAAAEAAVVARVETPRASATTTPPASAISRSPTGDDAVAGASAADPASTAGAGTSSAGGPTTGSNVSAGARSASAPGATTGSNVSAGTRDASAAGATTTGSNVSAGTRDASAAGATTTGSNVSAGTLDPAAGGGRNVSAGTRSASLAGGTSSSASAGTHTGRDVVPPAIAQTRADIAAGRFDVALASATAALAQQPASGAWLLVRADALRGLGRAADAADAYEAASGALADTDKLAAAYTAAYVRFHDLHDGPHALAELADVIVPSSPFEERGLALRVQILVSLGRTADAREAARAYLGRYPHGDLRAYMLHVEQAP